MSEPDPTAVVEAFLEDLSRRQRVNAKFIANYHNHVLEFLEFHRGRELEALDTHDIEHYIGARVGPRQDAEQTSEARMATRALIQFLRSGGLEQVRSAPPDPAEAELLDEAILGLMREDIERVWCLDGAAFCAAVTAPLVLVALGGTMALLGYLLHYASMAGTFFMVLAHVAEDQPGLPKGASDNLTRNFGRGLAVTIVGFLPALLTNALLMDSALPELVHALLLFLAALVGALLVPAAALAVYASRSGLAALAPHLWYRIVDRIPRPYARVAVLYAGLIAALQLWAFVLGLAFGPLPTLVQLLFGPVACLSALAMAAGLGGVIRRNRFVLGL